MRKQKALPEQVDNARRLRRDATVPERMLWARLKDRHAIGYVFRRQHLLDRYIVDFCCPKAKIVIELDGRSHSQRGDADIQRQKKMEEIGYQIIRFTNDDVLKDLDAVVDSILAAAGARVSS